MSNGMQIKIVADRSKEVLENLERLVGDGLIGVGLEAEKFAKKDCPVDTGRLRNSITYATTESQGGANEGGFRTKDGGTPEMAKPEDYEMHATPEGKVLYIGTNVEYAGPVEYKDLEHNVGKAHFLRDSLATHGAKYKKIMEAALKGSSAGI